MIQGHTEYMVDPHVVTVVQSRAEMRFDTVDEYAIKMREGVEFDACFGVLDTVSKTIYVWDGCHRIEAAKKAGVQVKVECTPGHKNDAEGKSLSANAKHGLQRTNDDIERVCKNALRHAYSAQMSNRELAKHCGVNDKTIAKYRTQLEAAAEIEPAATRTVTRNGTTYKQAVSSGSNGSYSKSPNVRLAPRCLFCNTEQRIKPTLDPKRGICLSCALMAARELATGPCDICKLGHPHCNECCRECETPCNAQQRCRMGEKPL